MALDNTQENKPMFDGYGLNEDRKEKEKKGFIDGYYGAKG